MRSLVLWLCALGFALNLCATYDAYTEARKAHLWAVWIWNDAHPDAKVNWE